ncbi:MAG: NAD(P)/FAD-dependent oxidoreductase [Oceanospirillaceae bacterium]|nr:NAD(P)/FAD-dependent oxidoreductase [Oceanospirillaceae bacterium]MCP5350277.1 NAD(P)/FAD-dependent oxidoreductase [Oceanospirillaceae bacterium]
MNYDAIIIGAGAAGLMTAISAAQRGRRVLVLDHANKAGKKILISGGGRCNFTNMYVEPANYLSANPHFCKSALNRYTQWDFIELLSKHDVPWHEKTLGQLFSDNGSKAILQVLLDECSSAGVQIQLDCQINRIEKITDGFALQTNQGNMQCLSLVVATGSLSFPTMGASDFGHRIAKQFGHSVTQLQPGLVPFTLDKPWIEKCIALAGVAIDARATVDGQSFKEALLFTHKGVSGPVILQISSYWKPGKQVEICMLPDVNLFSLLKDAQAEFPKRQLGTVLSQHIAQRLLEQFVPEADLKEVMQHFKHSRLQEIADIFQNWQFIPSGTEGYKKAEVTLGGVNTDEVSSKTLESKIQPGLYFVGEVLDVTGHLGGFNFQWAWASGHCCGQFI